MVKQGCHVVRVLRQLKPRTMLSYEVVGDREEQNDELDALSAMRVIELTQPGVDSEASWVRKDSQSIFGYK